MKILIGVDFSIAKPAVCVYDGINYKFYSWVKNLPDRLVNLYSDCGVHIRKRIHDDNKILVHSDLINSNILADMIIEDLTDYIINKAEFIFEGTSFASKGNQLISLTAWRYILMQRLYVEGVPYKNMHTYAPISIKKTAGCSKKGMGKKEMIDAFSASACDHPLKHALKEDRDLFMKKGGKNHIDHLDDLVDAYWAIETFLEKNPKVARILQE